MGKCEKCSRVHGNHGSFCSLCIIRMMGKTQFSEIGHRCCSCHGLGYNHESKSKCIRCVGTGLVDEVGTGQQELDAVIALGDLFSPQEGSEG